MKTLMDEYLGIIYTILNQTNQVKVQRVWDSRSGVLERSFVELREYSSGMA